METTPLLQNESKICCARKRSKLFAILILAGLFGFIGGVLSPLALRFFDKQLATLGITEKNVSEPSVVKTDSIAEDKIVTDLVAKNAPGVVSIVISRDVPKARSFFNNPFGRSLPFFFNPFGPQGGGGTQGGDVSQGTEKKQVGSGSGFFVSADGLIVTNRHVVSDEQAEYTVIINSGVEYSAKVLARDTNNDIAIIKIEGQDFPALALGDSDIMLVGQTALAIGNSLGEFANSVSRGIISGPKRNVSADSGFGDTERLTNIIQTDAAINPGNSGGPLFNLSGEVIGVNVAMASGAENIGFALPINQVRRVVEQVRQTGKITVPYIGVRYVIINKDIQKQNNLDFDYGALILRGQRMTDLAVIPGSPADKAGLVENDIILEINGEKIDGDHLLASFINQYAVGDEIALKVWHKGETKNVKLKLEEKK
jgi:S1-C subfamily serine protease